MFWRLQAILLMLRNRRSGSSSLGFRAGSPKARRTQND